MVHRYSGPMDCLTLSIHRYERSHDLTQQDAPGRMRPMKTTTTSRKFVGYYRVSTAKQGRSGLGLEAQRELVRQFLTGSTGFPPIVEFVEEESGRNDKRPALAAALAACRVHRATLIIAKLDRLSRNQRFLMELVDSGVDVQFCDLPQIPPGAAGRFMLQQMASVAELEAGLISERTRAALRAKVARDGQWDRKAAHHLRPGIGQSAATAAVKALADARAADLAGHIQTLQARGITSLNALAQQLDAEGIATARGGQWTATAVRRVLERARQSAQG